MGERKFLSIADEGEGCSGKDLRVEFVLAFFFFSDLFHGESWFFDLRKFFARNQGGGVFCRAKGGESLLFCVDSNIIIFSPNKSFCEKRKIQIQI